MQISFIPYGKQYLDQNDIDEVVKVLRSDFLTQGNLIGKFEDDLSNVVQCSYAKMFYSATSALHAACVALEKRPSRKCLG